MPIFDYKCKACDHTFEAVVLPPALEKPECPSCHARELEQLISTFALNTDSTSKASFAKAKVRANKTIREQRIGLQEDMADHH